MLEENELVRIVPFEPAHQADIDLMLADISTEYKEPIFSPIYKKISELYLLPDRQYWSAVANGRAIGTVGAILASGNNVVLKAMFLHKSYRANGQQIALRLLETAIHWAAERECAFIYLGTMEQFKAAQRFYEKNGFDEIQERELPPDYPSNKMDTRFYQKEIKLPTEQPITA